MLKGIKNRYEKHHEIIYTDDALVSAAEYSEKYITDRFLPDKAIDLIDEAGARRHLSLIHVPQDIRQLEKDRQEIITKQGKAFNNKSFEEVARLQQSLILLDDDLNKKRELWKKELKNMNNFVTREDIAEIISNTTQIPIKKMVESESDKLAKMEDNLHHRVISPPYALKAVNNAIRRNPARMQD